MAAARATVAIGPVPNHVRIRFPDARPRDRIKSQLLKSQAFDSESRIRVWGGQVTSRVSMLACVEGEQEGARGGREH